MSVKSKIEWTQSTWNPVTGCTKVSSGCKNCYAEREWPRLSANPKTAYYGRKFSDIQGHADRLSQPIRWSIPKMIFVNSMSDLFHESVTDEFIDSVFGVMWACFWGRDEQPGHIFQVLTKRANRMRDYMLQDRREHWARAAVHYGGGKDPDGIYDQVMDAEGPHPRIWLGVSIEDQQSANERIPLLLQTPAAVRWVSAEPLLGEVNLHRLNEGDETNELDCLVPWTWEQEIESWRGTSDTWEDDFLGHYNIAVADANGPTHNKIDWVVVGGETGPAARPMLPQWVSFLRDQCAESRVPFMFKQWGKWLPDNRLLDGVLHDEYPLSESICPSPV